MGFPCDGPSVWAQSRSKIADQLLETNPYRTGKREPDEGCLELRLMSRERAHVSFSRQPQLMRLGVVITLTLMLLHPLTPLLLHLIVLLLLIVIQHCFDLGIAGLPEAPHFCPAVLLGKRAVVVDALHLLLPIGQDRQNLIFLVVGEIQPLAESVDLLLGIGVTPMAGFLVLL
jgi:hypothetical protein